jgi:hypothetical protein
LNVGIRSADARRQAASHVSGSPVHELTLHDVTDDVIASLCLEGLWSRDGNRRSADRRLGMVRDSLYSTSSVSELSTKIRPTSGRIDLL